MLQQSWQRMKKAGCRGWLPLRRNPTNPNASALRKCSGRPLGTYSDAKDFPRIRDAKLFNYIGIFAANFVEASEGCIRDKVEDKAGRQSSEIELPAEQIEGDSIILAGKSGQIIARAAV